MSSTTARQTHCKRGHEFTQENTCQRSDGRRRCRTCAQADWRRYHARRVAASGGFVAVNLLREIARLRTSLQRKHGEAHEQRKRAEKWKQRAQAAEWALRNKRKAA